jgi:hypothetical protein
MRRVVARRPASCYLGCATTSIPPWGRTGLDGEDGRKGCVSSNVTMLVNPRGNNSSADNNVALAA